MKYSKIFLGENRYTTGLVFMFATLIGFFTHMRKLEIDTPEMFGILMVVSVVSFGISML